MSLVDLGPYSGLCALRDEYPDHCEGGASVCCSGCGKLYCIACIGFTSLHELQQDLISLQLPHYFCTEECLSHYTNVYDSRVHSNSASASSSSSTAHKRARSASRTRIEPLHLVRAPFGFREPIWSLKSKVLARVPLYGVLQWTTCVVKHYEDVQHVQVEDVEPKPHSDEKTNWTIHSDNIIPITYGQDVVREGDHVLCAWETEGLWTTAYYDARLESKSTNDVDVYLVSYIDRPTKRFCVPKHKMVLVPPVARLGPPVGPPGPYPKWRGFSYRVDINTRPLDALPLNAVALIFRHLSLRDLNALSCVCLSMRYHVAHQSYAFKHYLEKHVMHMSANGEPTPSRYACLAHWAVVRVQHVPEHGDGAPERRRAPKRTRRTGRTDCSGEEALVVLQPGSASFAVSLSRTTCTDAHDALSGHATGPCALYADYIRLHKKRSAVYANVHEVSLCAFVGNEVLPEPSLMLDRGIVRHQVWRSFPNLQHLALRLPRMDKADATWDSVKPRLNPIPEVLDHLGNTCPKLARVCIEVAPTKGHHVLRVYMVRKRPHATRRWKEGK